ncbi:MAG: hypothetical protein LDL41_14345 [Coleofasciculus sp. S288]|nr:hypothetical protein [Coleofasciculus sp. S288]
MAQIFETLVGWASCPSLKCYLKARSLSRVHSEPRHRDFAHDFLVNCLVNPVTGITESLKRGVYALCHFRGYGQLESLPETFEVQEKNDASGGTYYLIMLSSTH